MGEVYAEHKDMGGFLYVNYSMENTFGAPETVFHYKTQKSFLRRRANSSEVRFKNPDTILIIVEKGMPPEKCTAYPICKVSVDGNIPIGQILARVCEKQSLKPEETVYLFVRDTGQLYSK